MKLHVRYFAILREQTGKNAEHVDTIASTPAALFEELNVRYPFTLHAHQLKVAVNSEFCDWQSPLKDGDTVVFIPPVAGG